MLYIEPPFVIALTFYKCPIINSLNSYIYKNMEREIILVKPRGFCAGVERAVQIVEMALEKYDKPIYVRHEIVHNKYVVNDLKNKGAIFVNELRDVPKGALVIFSAHGVSDAVEKEAADLKLHIIDATCPLVTKIHKQAQKYEQKNKNIILIGHAGHPEVEGTIGRVKSHVHLVQNLDDVEKLNIDNHSDIAYVTQTTLSMDDTKNIIQALQDKFPNIEGPGMNDICYATQNRQKAVRELAKVSDLILIIGAQNSSNSNRLKDIAIQCKINSYLINDVNDIKIQWFEDVRKIGITAGASAPEILIKVIVDFLCNHFNINKVKTLEAISENVKFKLPII